MSNASTLNQGELKDFKLQAFLDVVNELVRADEIERALWVLNNLPAYYRDFPPQQILELRNKILAKIATPTIYSTSKFDANIAFDDRHSHSKTMRAQFILMETEFLNKNNIVPHIVDYGPGEYWLPFLLKRNGIRFTYEAIYLAKGAHELAIPHLKEECVPKGETSPTILIACEIIEHLWNEEDIKTEMLAHCGLADIIHISTPRYTNAPFCLDWDKEKEHLGHLRAYTPNDFVNMLFKMFPEYHQKYFDSFIMHMRLTKKGIPDEIVTLFDPVTVQEIK